jgi:ankyrin repeat protein
MDQHGKVVFEEHSDTFGGTDDDLEFYKACDHGRYEEAKTLLESGRVSDIDCCNEFDYTPLIATAKTKAAEEGPTKGRFPEWLIPMMKMLLENGANPNMETDAKETALHWACKRNNLALVKLLLGQDPDFPIGTGKFKVVANVFHEDRKGETARIEAEKKRYTNILYAVKKAEQDQKKSGLCTIL